jgi:hypothetical protein
MKTATVWSQWGADPMFRLSWNDGVITRDLVPDVGPRTAQGIAQVDDARVLGIGHHVRSITWASTRPA